MSSYLAMFGLPGYAEILIVAIVGLLLFGKRLPEVARSLGRSVVEFKKGVRDIRDDVDRESNSPSPPRLDQTKPSSTLPSSAATGTTEQAQHATERDQ